MRFSLSPKLYRAWEISCHIGHLINRGFELTEALVGVTAGTGMALTSAALLRLSDLGLVRLAKELLPPTFQPAVENVRLLLIAVIFAGLIWAAHSCRRTREWFDPQTYGGRNG